MNVQKRQKVYAFVDESGQDDASRFFVVVAVVSDRDQDILRKQLEEVEEVAQTGKMKWHKSRHVRRTKYLSLVLERKIAAGEVYFRSFEKPLPYFFPMLDVLEKALKRITKTPHKAFVHVDGIDIQKAKELTNALRAHGITLGLVRSRRDESEPLIRLADMWAGCIRGSLRGSKEYMAILQRAKKEQYLHEITT